MFIRVCSFLRLISIFLVSRIDLTTCSLQLKTPKKKLLRRFVVSHSSIGSSYEMGESIIWEFYVAH